MRKKYFNDNFRDGMGFKHKAQLERDLNRLNVKQISEKYGVNQGTIRYWIKKFRLRIKHRYSQKRKNIKILTIGINESKSKRLYHPNPIYKRKRKEMRKFYDEQWDNGKAEK